MATKKVSKDLQEINIGKNTFRMDDLYESFLKYLLEHHKIDTDIGLDISSPSIIVKYTDHLSEINAVYHKALIGLSPEKTLEEKAQERIHKLKELSLKLKTPESLNEIENSPKKDLDRFELQFVYHETKIKKIEEKFTALQEEHNQLKEQTFNTAANYGSETKVQLIPINIYLDTNNSEEIFEVYQATYKFIDSIGFKKMIELDAVKGSWYKKIVAMSKSPETKEAITSRLKEGEYAIEVNAILKPQSEVDLNQSQALLNIITSLEKVPNAAIRIGALLVVKITSKDGEVSVTSRSLSIKELHLLNKKPGLLTNPQSILDALSNEINGEDHLGKTLIS